jgi:hypothetical protein
MALSGHPVFHAHVCSRVKRMEGHFGQPDACREVSPAALMALRESGAPSTVDKINASSGGLPAPNFTRSSICAFRCSRSASARISGRVMSHASDRRMSS